MIENYATRTKFARTMLLGVNFSRFQHSVPLAFLRGYEMNHRPLKHNENTANEHQSNRDCFADASRRRQDCSAILLTQSYGFLCLEPVMTYSEKELRRNGIVLEPEEKSGRNQEKFSRQKIRKKGLDREAKRSSSFSIGHHCEGVFEGVCTVDLVDLGVDQRCRMSASVSFSLVP